MNKFLRLLTNDNIILGIDHMNLVIDTLDRKKTTKVASLGHSLINNKSLIKIFTSNQIPLIKINQSFLNKLKLH